MPIDVKWLGHQVSRLRSKLGLQQQELARQAGMSQAYVNRLEHGLIANPKINDLVVIAQALQVSLEDLIGTRPSADEDHALAILRRHPWLVAVTANLVSGLQWADERERAIILSHLDLLVQRYGQRSGPAEADDASDALAVARRLSLLRFARPLPAAAKADEILMKSLEDALILVGGEVATAYRWDRGRERLVLARSTVPTADQLKELKLGEGASGQAALRREPVVLDDYAQHPESHPFAAAGGVSAAVAAPFVFQDQLLGTLIVTCVSSLKRFGQVDAGALGALASDVAARLAAAEQSTAG